MRSRHPVTRLVALLLLGASIMPARAASPLSSPDPRREAMRIQPCASHPRYWQYRGNPVILLGGSVDDNLFQIPELKDHLDLLAAVGGNYLRNTMSDRPDNGYEIKAFTTTAEGKYDPDRWNDQYWERFAARDSLGEYFTFYNEERRHSSLDGRTPAAVYWQGRTRIAQAG